MKFVTFLFFVLVLKAEILDSDHFQITDRFPLNQNELSLTDKAYLKIEYNNQVPTRFLVKAYYQGQELDKFVRTDPVPLHGPGFGQTLTWIRFLQNTKVDQVSIESRGADFKLLSRKSLGVDWVWKEKFLHQNVHKIPLWVTSLSQAQEKLIGLHKNGYLEAQNFTESIVLEVLYFLFSLYVLAQYYALKVARGSWRRKVKLPIFLFIPAFIAGGAAYVSQSHLWAVPVLVVAPVALLYFSVIVIWYKNISRQAPKPTSR